MQTEPSENQHLSLAAALEQCLRQPARPDASKRGPSIGELCEAVGEKGFGLLLVLSQVLVHCHFYSVRNAAIESYELYFLVTHHKPDQKS